MPCPAVHTAAVLDVVACRLHEPYRNVNNAPRTKADV